jgi:large subunit ribosomal protein L32
MAVPFRKISKTRGRMRRTHYKIEANNTVKCSNCGAAIRPHRVCPECGFYKGKNVTEKVVAETKTVETKKATPKKETKKVEKTTKETKKTTKKATK